MAAIPFRAVAFGLLVIAVALHVAGFATHNWITAKLDSRGVAGIASANGLDSSSAKGGSFGMDINMGLWRFCLKMTFNFGSNTAAINEAAKNVPGQPSTSEWGESKDAAPPSGQDTNEFQDEDWKNEYQDMPVKGSHPAQEVEEGSSLGDMGIGSGIDMCQSPPSSQIPGWMKGVQALGILSLIVAVLGMACTIYSLLGDSKGDRARLLPYISGGICLAAGLLLLIAVIVYDTEYNQMMENQMAMLGSSNPELQSLAENVKENTSLGVSFVLEVVSAVLMMLTSLLLTIPAMRGWETTSQFGGKSNMAI